MKTKVTFLVTMSPYPMVNQLMRDLDFFEKGAGAAIEQKMTVTWKEGEVVNEARIRATAEVLKKGLIEQKYDCFEVLPIKTWQE